MGLFSNTVINKSIASLFGSTKTRDDQHAEDAKSKNKLTTEKAKEEPNRKPEVKQSSELKNKHDDIHGNESSNGGMSFEDKVIRGSSETSDSNDLLEDDYMRRLAKAQTVDIERSSVPSSKNNADDSVTPTGESELASIVPAATDAAKTNIGADAGSKIDLESTLFVKNVPYSVITDRKVFKKFKKHFGPGIKSVRFRSIAMSEILPRKVAFIKQKLNESRDAVNCYIVYESRSSVEQAMKTLNCTEFDGHHLFVDDAAHPRSQDNKRTVFIGNLSFDATEEKLYQFFVDCGPIENLRIVRDRKYNIGKGFAYVEFEDVSSVQLALMKNDTELEGRKLRVTRCMRTAGSSSGSNKHSTKKAAKLSNSAKSVKPAKSFKEKQTQRSKAGDPKLKKSKSSDGEILEGERSKPGMRPQLGRKRKARHENGRVKKRMRSSK